MKMNLSKRVLSAFLCVLLIMSYVPFAASAAQTDSRVVDEQTLDNYTDLFYNGTGSIDTYTAGAVWSDKSVVTDPALLHPDVTMKDKDNNFLVSLSALASNKEIVGYSAIPTDTMFILDASSSMTSTDLRDVTNATNEAIKQLNKVGNHNRIGVVVYNGTASMLMDLDRYTPNSSGNYLTFTGNNTISIASGVRNSKGAVSGSVSEGTGTYTQGGIFLAMQELLAADTTVESGQIQGGTGRMPIFVLMTDGDPSFSSSRFTNATNSAKDSGSFPQESNRNTFLTMLTAAYAKNQVSAHYDRPALFYTLGYGISSSSNHAPNVLDTDNMTSPFAGYAASYEQAANGSTVVAGNLSVRKIVEITTLKYVDRYFSASSGDLNSAFDEIIQEIIIQSRYYATHINGIDPDFDGYLTFEDKLGEYMEFKALDGIVHGNDYFTGAALAKRINVTDLGTIQNPTDFGIAFRDSVKERLGITDNGTAFDLIADAYAAGQLSYTSDSVYSNYIGWYQKADGSYAGFYNEGTTVAPEGAVYKNRSYGFLGKVNANTVNESDMMFMSVMLRTEIATGEQTVMWRIPASIIPMITYNVTLDGTDIHTANLKSLEVERNTPVRLVYEVGLNNSVINKYNVRDVMEADTDSAKHVSGDDYVFWTNFFDRSAPEHEDHIATFSHFVPNVRNERYYYTEDTPVYIKTATGYSLVTDRNHVFDTTANEYYHIRYYFTEGQNEVTKEYDRISDISIGAENRLYDNGQWFIKRGTVYRMIYPTSIIEKSENKTNSIMFAYKPFITIENGVPTATVKLGNNGRISLTPETGIRVSKAMEEGVISDEIFEFEVTLSSNATASSYPYMRALTNEISGTEGTLSVKSGNKLTFEIKAGETMWITGIPSGTTYTVNEISDDYVYAVKEASVNGVVTTDKTALGTVTEHKIDDVNFVNGFADKGTLSITKTVRHPYGPAYQIPANINFTALVKLTNGGSPLANYEYEITTAGAGSTDTTNANGEAVINIKNGETVMLGNLPENTEYTVIEQNIPAGFTQITPASDLTGTITTAASVANLVNVYEAEPVTPKVKLNLSKNLIGRDWLAGETFSFTLVRFGPSDVSGTTIKNVSAFAQNANVNIDLSTETYEAPGRYRYLLTEKTSSAENGITYDTAERQFAVTVADSDMDGKLEITSVENIENTTVTGNAADGYTVSASRFNNKYAAVKGASINLDVQKIMDAAGGNHSLNGFKFGLYDSEGNVIESTVTDVAGKAHFAINYSPDVAGQTFRYELKEINNGIHGITYDSTVYNVVVEIIDNYDGTTSADVSVSLNGSPYTDTVKFTNRYTPDSGKLWLDAVKVMSGRELNADEFTFNLLDENRQVLQTKTNAADGTVLFDEITVNAAKDYVFYIVEVKGDKGGVTYSEEEYKVVSTIVQDGSEYVEKSTVYYNKNGGIVNGADFHNSYKPAPAYFTVTGTKHLTGRELRDSDNFMFELKDAKNTVLQTVENSGDKIEFAPIKFTDAGTYTYYVSEQKGSVAGITYDESVFEVTITVTDDGLGKLHADMAVISKERAAESIMFNNTYAPAPVKDTLQGLKILENKKLTDGEFDFALISVLSGETVETVKNAADGKFGFEITFDVAGTYHYDVKEVNTHHSHISYDNTVYAIGYEVTDDGNGQLKAEKVIKIGDTAVNDIIFTNVNNPEEITATVNVKKVLENKTTETMGLDGFKFKLAGDNIEDQTLITDTNGDAGFTLKYTVADNGKTYNYKLTEINTAIEGMTYDESEIEASVKITLTDDGKLETEITQGGEPVDAITATFNNVYEGKPEPTPEPEPQPDPQPEPTPEPEPEPQPQPEPTPEPEQPEQPEKPGNPNTGDDTNLQLWITLLFVSGGGIFATVLFGGKKREEEN
ncbi:MAG: VWA domain-containing protein [Clostridia bacterium]|nr:VWA domain-containing protein [Clostridia bacterium]